MAPRTRTTTALLLAAAATTAAFQLVVAPRSLRSSAPAQRRHNVMSSPPGTLGVTLLRSTAYDELVAAAEKATADFGAESPEAKSAWEAVEEQNAVGDVAIASKPGLDVECDTSDDAACVDYNAQLAELQQLIASSKPALETMKAQLSTLASAPLAGLAPAATAETKGGVDVEALTSAAEKATAEFGAESPEAKMAWEAVEDMYDSANAATASAPGLDEACLTDAVEKCAAFETAMAALEESIAKSAA